MGHILSNVSNLIIPLLLFFVVGYGLLHRVKIYEEFVKGAKDGFQTVIQIMPTLVGLMIAVGVLRASGFLDFLAQLLTPLADLCHIPAVTLPLLFIKMFSSSAATGMVLSLFKQFGTDSYIGMFVSIVVSCTETIFYTMSVYFLVARVTKTRWTLPGALLSSLSGVIASAILAAIV
jgi:spore maturation protein B